MKGKECMDSSEVDPCHNDVVCNPPLDAGNIFACKYI